MTHASPVSVVANDDIEVALPAEAETHRTLSRWLLPLEVVSAALMFVIVALLLGGVVARYAFGAPVVWIDEAVSIAFIWLAMIGAAIAMHRNEHLRLTLLLDKLPSGTRDFVHACALVRPGKVITGLEPPSVRKKLKQPSFAAGVHRDEVYAGAELLGLALDEHIANVIAALQPIAPQLGLRTAADAA